MRMFSLRTMKQWGFKERRVVAFVISLIAVIIIFLWQGSGYISFTHQNILEIDLNTETKIYWGDSGGFICDTVHRSCIELNDEQCEFVKSCIAKTFLFTRNGVYTFTVEQKPGDTYKYKITSYCIATEAGTRRKWSV